MIKPRAAVPAGCTCIIRPIVASNLTFRSLLGLEWVRNSMQRGFSKFSPGFIPEAA